MISENEVKDIVLRDLEPLLREKLGDRLIVDSFITKKLLPPGENYGSTILSVDAVIRKSRDAEKEDLRLIAKMSPPTEYQKCIFDSPYTFKKEIFMYKDIMPSYNELERECGIEEDQLFDVLPKFYGYRLSLDPELDFDDNAVILLENLKARGYYTADRSKGYDLEHSKVAIRAMARFHALGMGVKYKKPEDFEVLKKRSKCVELQSHNFDTIHQGIFKKIEEDPVISQYIGRCSNALKDMLTVGSWTAVPDEPWSTIIHADFWVNNIMFHRDENGTVDDVKFVDFQNYLFFSPLREMVFYLFCSVDDTVDNEQIEGLMTLYYETFTSTLRRLGCDTEPFTREKFEKKVNDDARLEFMHLCFMLKVLTLDVKEIDFDVSQVQNVMIGYEGNQSFVDRLRKVVLYFIERNWI
ncbi:hypothetical protein KM043_005309 [Ampulex compressa]|nr:hypothetical protein KM043_005309 [Ampulex compressa]